MTTQASMQVFQLSARYPAVKWAPSFSTHLRHLLYGVNVLSESKLAGFQRGPQHMQQKAHRSTLYSYVLQGLLYCSKQQGSEVCFWLAAGPLESNSDIWIAMLSLLHHSWQNTHSISTHEVATLLTKLARSTSHTRIHSLVVEWASDAAMQYLSSAQPSSESPSTPSPAAVGQQNPGQAGGLQHQDLLCPDAFFEVLMRLCRAPKLQNRLSAVQALSKLLHAGLRFQPHQLVAVADIACYHLTDPSELVSEASVQLLLGLAAPASFSIMSSAVSAAQHELPWRRLYALQPQQVAFQPEQLAELLQWLGQTAPLVVSQPGPLSGSAANDTWLWSMLKSCQTMGSSVTFPL